MLESDLTEEVKTRGGQIVVKTRTGQIVVKTRSDRLERERLVECRLDQLLPLRTLSCQHNVTSLASDFI